MTPVLTLSAVARRWYADRHTVRAALTAASVDPAPEYARSSYPLSSILKIEGWNDDEHGSVDLSQPLLRAEQLALQLGVTAQTVRNYGRAGRVRTVRLTSRTLRFLPSRRCEASLGERANL